MKPTIPVVLFAYARPAHLARTLACLRENAVPRIFAFADGAKADTDRGMLNETRALLREVDWCDLRLVEREQNLGLGKNVRAGVTAVAAEHDTFIVWEDDLIAVPGTYQWMCAALERYAADERVMSVSAWTHPRVTPADVGTAPYFDRRADCWVWGAWARSWRGMNDTTALEKMVAAERRGISRGAYGADLPIMARVEEAKNIWAVRWLYHHLSHGGLCLRPPWSMVEHIGFDAQATHAAGATDWANPPLRSVPPVPAAWPEPAEHPDCRALWREANPRRSILSRLMARGGRAPRKWARKWAPEFLRRGWHAFRARNWFTGDYATWAEARATCTGYDDGIIVERVLAATRAVRDGRAAYEQDSVVFAEPSFDERLVQALLEVARRENGRLHVLDFGGSLGSTWWRHRARLTSVRDLAWDVVEQPRFVAAGRAEFAETPLRFFESIAEAQQVRSHNVLLVSTTLQYLESPHATLESWMKLSFPFLLLNNLPLHADKPDRLAVQRVPAEIYPASYPVWFFNREKLLALLGASYEVIAEFPGEAVWPVGWGTFPSTSLLLKRKEHT